MKILIINDHIGKGGKERRMLELVKALANDKSYQIVLVLLSDLIEYRMVYDLPIKLIIINRKTRWDPLVFFRLQKVVKQHAPNIIHSWGSMSNLYSLPIAKIFKCKFITSVISNAPINPSLRNKEYWRFKLIYPFADAITSNSLAGLKAYKVRDEKGVCIYNGFDFERIAVLEDSCCLKKKLLVEHKIVVGMVATFDNRKDYPTLLKAAFKILAKHANVVFILIGDGLLRQQMMEMVPEEFKAGIKFLGKLDDVEKYINIFDIAVLSSPSEGISNSILEYMALGKPVIATDGGGTKELVVDDVTGFLVPNSDVDTLEKKIIHLIEFPDKRKTLGLNGQQRVQQVFSLSKMYSQFSSIYSSVMRD